MENKTTYTKGQKVTTVHGEELTILNVKNLLVRRHGIPTGETMDYVLVESGGNNTWIPVTNLKTNKE
jgi:hypothetical protein